MSHFLKLQFFAVLRNILCTFTSLCYIVYMWTVFCIFPYFQTSLLKFELPFLVRTFLFVSLHSLAAMDHRFVKMLVLIYVLVNALHFYIRFVFTVSLHKTCICFIYHSENAQEMLNRAVDFAVSFLWSYKSALLL